MLTAVGPGFRDEASCFVMLITWLNHDLCNPETVFGGNNSSGMGAAAYGLDEVQPTQEAVEPVASANRKPADRSPPPVRTAGRKRKTKNNRFPRWERDARKLISLGASRWDKKEFDASIELRKAVEVWLQKQPPYWHRKAEGFLRELDRLRSQFLERRLQEDRGTGQQNEHPDRNGITEFRPPGGRGTWATPKNKR
jgi:hypothetical protein